MVYNPPQPPAHETADLRYPLQDVSPLVLLGVSTPIPLLRKHWLFFVGEVGLNTIHVAPTQPLYVAHESKHASKLVCVEFAISIDCPAGEDISVPQSLRKLVEGVVAGER
jgi:hypothetical protein